MATFKISFQNMGDELDSRTVKREEDLKQALLDLIEDVDRIYAGDRFIVTEE